MRASPRYTAKVLPGEFVKRLENECLSIWRCNCQGFALKLVVSLSHALKPAATSESGDVLLPPCVSVRSLSIHNKGNRCKVMWACSSQGNDPAHCLAPTGNAEAEPRHLALCKRSGKVGKAGSNHRRWARVKSQPPGRGLIREPTFRTKQSGG